MALQYKTPTQIADQYLLHVKSLKPEVNTDQSDSDWWVRSRVVGGVFSGIYADQRKIADDAFPQSARREALEKHVNLYFNEGFKPATQSVGPVMVSGATGTPVPLGLQMEYTPNGNLYTTTESITLPLDATTGIVNVQSLAAGQNQNLLEGAALNIPSPPAGLDSGAIVYGGNLSDGRNEESNQEAAERVLDFIRTPLAGGKVADYEAFAKAADPSVTSASVIRFPFGFGTVAVVITAGTSDIDTAINNGDPIVLIPSAALIDTVQTYIETQNPTTDCATVVAPASVTQDVTINVRFASGDKDTEMDAFGLTQGELVQREVRRAIYKTPPGGRRFRGASTGYVVASEIEDMLDVNLSANPYTVGRMAQILTDRQIGDLSATGPNRRLLGTEIAYPGTINVVEMS